MIIGLPEYTDVISLDARYSNGIFRYMRNKKKEAIQWAMNNLVGKSIYHQDIQGKIFFTRSGINHAIYAKSNSEKVELIYHAIDILKSSRLISIQKDKWSRPDVLGVYRFSTIRTINKKKYFIYIIVKKMKVRGSGINYFYDHGVIKELQL